MKKYHRKNVDYFNNRERRRQRDAKGKVYYMLNAENNLAIEILRDVFRRKDSVIVFADGFFEKHGEKVDSLLNSGWHLISMRKGNYLDNLGDEGILREKNIVTDSLKKYGHIAFEYYSDDEKYGMHYNNKILLEEGIDPNIKLN